MLVESIISSCVIYYGQSFVQGQSFSVGSVSPTTFPFKAKCQLASPYYVDRTYYSFLFRIINAPITPGIQPQHVRINTINTEPHPRSITANGGKIMANMTRNKLIINLCYYVGGYINNSYKPSECGLLPSFNPPRNTKMTFRSGISQYLGRKNRAAIADSRIILSPYSDSIHSAPRQRIAGRAQSGHGRVGITG